jgi:hypothetical protein
MKRIVMNKTLRAWMIRVCASNPTPAAGFLPIDGLDKNVDIASPKDAVGANERESRVRRLTSVAEDD